MLGAVPSSAGPSHALRCGANSCTAANDSLLARSPRVRRTKRYGKCRQDHSALMPADLITLAHLSVSSEMNFAKPADVSGIGSTPRSTRRAFDLGSARAAFIASFSLLTISVGVFLGTPSPYQPNA